MSESELHACVVERYLAAQTPLGRWRLNCCARWKGRFWRWMARATGVTKRGFDFAISLTLVILLMPMFLWIALLIKLEDGGPVLFVQKRVGKFGREFRMFKFRSMCPDAEQRLADLLSRNRHLQGVTFKIQEDPRITRVGRWLRKFSFDELPQLFNVVRGDMSLVGPRPPLPREVALYSLADRRRLAVVPGITCLWQIGGRSEIDFSGQVQLDVRYIESRSFWVDLKILIKTVPAVLSGRGAC